MTDPVRPLSGRRAQAAVNDHRIIEAARAVFLADPAAPIAAVADAAGVGMSALYRRYASKEDLLRRLCAEGLDRYIGEVEAALADQGDPWSVFRAFMVRAVDANTNALVTRLAGTFTPTPELYAAAERAQRLNTELFERTKRSGAIRADLEVDDLGPIYEQLASVHVGDEDRNRQLRRRYLHLLLDAIHAPSDDPLPGPAPTFEELVERWKTPAG
ncbi:MAG: TetR/AcrR family transcriptional regulator [Acidimicrobiales bacterium]